MPINTIYRGRSTSTILIVLGFMAPALLLVGCGGSGSGGPPIAPPTVTLSSPTAGASVSGPVTLQVATTSSAGIQSVQFTIDGVALGNLVTKSPYTESWDPASVPAGAHELAAVARDV